MHARHRPPFQSSTNVARQVAEGDVLQIKERSLRVVGSLPWFLMLNGQIVNVLDLLLAAEAGILASFHNQLPQEHLA
jgi:hypothetical protein